MTDAAPDRFASMKRGAETAARHRSERDMKRRLDSLERAVAELTARLDAIEGGTDDEPEEPRAKRTGKRSN